MKNFVCDGLHRVLRLRCRMHAQAKKCTSLDDALTAAKAMPLLRHFPPPPELLLQLARVQQSRASAETAVAQPGGRLIVLRAPNFGWNLALNLKIDGRTAANIVQGRRYDHFAPAGRSLL